MPPEPRWIQRWWLNLTLLLKKVWIKEAASTNRPSFQIMSTKFRKVKIELVIAAILKWKLLWISALMEAMQPSLTIICNKIVSISWTAQCTKWNWPTNRLSHTSRVLPISETRVTWSTTVATRILDTPTLCSQPITNLTTSLIKIRQAPSMSKAKQMDQGIRLRLVIKWLGVKVCS